MRVRFRGQERRRGVLLQGPAGWGEFSPFPEYDAPVTGRWLAAAQEAATRWLARAAPDPDPGEHHRAGGRSGEPPTRW